MPDGEERYWIRTKMLDTAKEYVTRQRNKSYGEPDEDFQRIAAICSAMGFRVETDGIVRHLTGSDVSRLMIGLKLARLAWSPDHEDSWVDIAGYAACGLEVASLEEARRADTQKMVDAAMGHSLLPQSNFRDLRYLTPAVREAAGKAIAGDPEELQDMGFLLVDSSYKEALDGDQDCDGDSHLFAGKCIFRVNAKRGHGDAG